MVNYDEGYTPTEHQIIIGGLELTMVRPFTAALWDKYLNLDVKILESRGTGFVKDRMEQIKLMFNLTDEQVKHIEETVDISIIQQAYEDATRAVNVTNKKKKIDYILTVFNGHSYLDLIKESDASIHELYMRAQFQGARMQMELMNAFSQSKEYFDKLSFKCKMIPYEIG